MLGLNNPSPSFLGLNSARLRPSFLGVNSPRASLTLFTSRKLGLANFRDLRN